MGVLTGVLTSVLEEDDLRALVRDLPERRVILFVDRVSGSNLLLDEMVVCPRFVFCRVARTDFGEVLLGTVLLRERWAFAEFVLR